MSKTTQKTEEAETSDYSLNPRIRTEWPKLFSCHGFAGYYGITLEQAEAAAWKALERFNASGVPFIQVGSKRHPLYLKEFQGDFEQWHRIRGHAGIPDRKSEFSSNRTPPPVEETKGEFSAYFGGVKFKNIYGGHRLLCACISDVVCNLYVPGRGWFTLTSEESIETLNFATKNSAKELSSPSAVTAGNKAAELTERLERVAQQFGVGLGSKPTDKELSDLHGKAAAIAPVK